MCFHYNQLGHKKVDFLRLMSGVVRAPALVTLRITDGRKGREYALVVRSQALQLQAGEAKVS